MLTENLWLQVKHGYHCCIQKLYHSLILASFALCRVHSSEPLTPTLKADTDRTKSTLDMTVICHLCLFSEHGFLILSIPAAKRQNFHDINNSFYYLLLSYMMWKSSNPILHTFLNSVITCQVRLLVNLRDTQELCILLFAALPCLMPS